MSSPGSLPSGSEAMGVHIPVSIANLAKGNSDVTGKEFNYRSTYPHKFIPISLKPFHLLGTMFLASDTPSPGFIAPFGYLGCLSQAKVEGVATPVRLLRGIEPDGAIIKENTIRYMGSAAVSA